MQLLLCAGKVNGFYKLLLHLFLLYLKLLVLGRTDLPGQLHNIETAASSGSVKLFVRVLWGLPALPLRSSQVWRGRRILCSSGLKICVLCRYYPCWTSYGLFHSIQVLPWQSTLSNQNTHDTYSAASGFLMFFPGQCIFWRSPDFISKKPTQVPERVQSLPGVSSQNPIAITCKGEGIWWQSGLAQSWWWCFFWEAFVKVCVLAVHTEICLHLWVLWQPLPSSWGDLFTRAVWWSSWQLGNIWDGTDTAEETRNSEEQLQSSLPSQSYLNPCPVVGGGVQRTG